MRLQSAACAHQVGFFSWLYMSSARCESLVLLHFSVCIQTGSAFVWLIKSPCPGLMFLIKLPVNRYMYVCMYGSLTRCPYPGLSLFIDKFAMHTFTQTLIIWIHACRTTTKLKVIKDTVMYCNSLILNNLAQ